jgi:hypothetical protein
MIVRDPKRRHLALIPLTIAPRHGHPGLFDARVGDRMICSSRQPLLDSARLLLAEGVAPDTRIEMRHAGADHIALQAKLGEAAKLRVVEGNRETVRFTRWSAFKSFALPTRSGKGRLKTSAPTSGTPKEGFDEAA